MIVKDSAGVVVETASKYHQSKEVEVTFEIWGLSSVRIDVSERVPFGDAMLKRAVAVPVWILLGIL